MLLPSPRPAWALSPPDRGAALVFAGGRAQIERTDARVAARSKPDAPVADWESALTRDPTVATASATLSGSV